MASELEQVKAEIKEVKAENKEVKAEIKEVKAEIKGINERIKDSSKRFDGESGATLQSLLLEEERRMTAMEGRLTAMENNLAELRAKENRLESQVQASSSSGVQKEALTKEALREVLVEHDNNKGKGTIKCSNVSAGTMGNILASQDISVVNETYEREARNLFDPFDWKGRKEDDAIAEVRDHVETQLKKFGAPVGGQFNLVDVHKMSVLFNLDIEALPKIKGGTDFVIVPNNVAELSYSSQICIVFEIKTDTRLRNEGLNASIPQLVMEMLAARVYTNQPNVMAVLTDATTTACVLVFRLSDSESLNIHQYLGVDLDILGELVTSHLKDTALSVPKPDYRPTMEGNLKPEEALVRQCKRKYPFPAIESTLAWEHFQEMLPDTKPLSAERAVVINQLFRSFGWHSNLLLSDYPPVDNSASLYI